MAAVESKVWLPVEDAMRQIRNVYCVGRNYRDHASELGNAVPTEPMLFGKWTHALAACKGDLALPANRTNIHHELEIVFMFGRAYEPGMGWTDAVSGVALGLDLTDRDAQNRLKTAGQPWEYAKAFPGSAVLTDFYRVEDFAALAETEFSLAINGKTVQVGVATEMVFPFATLVEFVGRTFGFGAGDILYTGTPAGVGPLRPGDQLVLQFDGVTWGTCVVTTK
jgi:fumarylpyruvate hydrolase